MASIELGAIVKNNKAQYMRFYPLTCQQDKALTAIENCRTSKLGAHIMKCNHCSHEQIHYNSCRNRHCPKCQGSKQLQWVEKVKQQLLPCRYFHVVFTIPDILHNVMYKNQGIMYDILIRSAASALLQVCSNPEFLGAKTGCLTILHTWGQNLMFHPHVHMIVPAGGLSEDGWEWIHSSKKFFVPIKVLSKVFRAKFMSMAQKFLANEAKDYVLLKQKLYNINWNVYCKKAMADPSQVITYLGRYTHRVAISNSRILSVNDNKVVFRYKDYRDQIKKWKTMTLSQLEFIRRFLLHILPDNFYKIRYYGLFALGCRKLLIKRCLYLLGLSETIIATTKSKMINMPYLCPVCHIGKLTFDRVAIKLE